jgi:Spy/CpxP family protein refolding chaperone
LTDGQRASLLQAIEGQREKARDLEQRLRTARRELLETGLTDKFDEALVRRKALAVAQLEAELTVARFKAFSQMRPRLSPDQLTKLANTPGLQDEAREEAPHPQPDAPPHENGSRARDRSTPESGKTP